MLTDHAVPRSAKARVRSCGGPGAGAWLAALPADAGLSFSDEEFAVALRFRLGQDLCLAGQRCANTYVTAGDQRRVGDRCPGTLDAAGLHAATCLVGGRRKHTHNGQRALWAPPLPGAGRRRAANRRPPPRPPPASTRDWIKLRRRLAQA